MREFKTILQQEFLKRSDKNPGYSLRAYAQSLGINHATLSSLMSGKRSVTPSTISKLGHALKLGPEKLAHFNSAKPVSSYFTIQQDAYNAMSEWYFDAILELSKIKNFRIESFVISSALGISELQAKIALETLERLEMLIRDAEGKFTLSHDSSTTILDSNFSSAADRKYQTGLLQKSIEAVESVARKERDHTSVAMAIQKSDILRAKKMIQKFRRDLDKFLQRGNVEPDEVYQLQISFFPLTQISKNKKRSSK